MPSYRQDVPVGDYTLVLIVDYPRLIVRLLKGKTYITPAIEITEEQLDALTKGVPLLAGDLLIRPVDGGMEVHHLTEPIVGDGIRDAAKAVLKRRTAIERTRAQQLREAQGDYRETRARVGFEEE